MPKVCIEFDESGNGNGNGSGVRSYATTLGDGSTTTFNVEHNLDSRDVFLMLRNLTNGEVNRFPVTVRSLDADTSVLTFTTAPAAGAVRLTALAAPVSV